MSGSGSSKGGGGGGGGCQYAIWDVLCNDVLGVWVCGLQIFCCANGTLLDVIPNCCGKPCGPGSSDCRASGEIWEQIAPDFWRVYVPCP